VRVRAILFFAVIHFRSNLLSLGFFAEKLFLSTDTTSFGVSTDAVVHFSSIFVYRPFDNTSRQYTETHRYSANYSRVCVYIGSDFRFENILSVNHRDDEPPKGLGQYLFASVVVNHASLAPYWYTGKIYRGMYMTSTDLIEYVPGARILTRSFLSSSTCANVAAFFLDSNVFDAQPVLLVYQVKQKHTCLAAWHLSSFPEEQETLITPFVAFKVERVAVDALDLAGGRKATQIFMIEITSETGTVQTSRTYSYPNLSRLT
jgi:hypothetical protein